MDCACCGRKIKFSESSYNFTGLYVNGCGECNAIWKSIQENISQMVIQDQSEADILTYIDTAGFHTENLQLQIHEYLSDVKIRYLKEAGLLPEKRNRLYGPGHDEEQIKQVRERLKQRLDQYLIWSIVGARGRNLAVYPHKCIIRTDVTLGSVLTRNATDGEKTIFYQDVVGVQFKKSGAMLGYLQLETPGCTMNNTDSNFFNENTFTFEGNNELMIEVYEYVLGQIEEIKLGKYKE